MNIKINDKQTTYDVSQLKEGDWFSFVCALKEPMNISLVLSDRKAVQINIVTGKLLEYDLDSSYYGLSIHKYTLDGMEFTRV